MPGGFAVACCSPALVSKPADQWTSSLPSLGSKVTQSRAAARCFAWLKKLLTGGYSIITHASVQLMGQELLEGVSA